MEQDRTDHLSSQGVRDGPCTYLYLHDIWGPSRTVPILRRQRLELGTGNGPRDSPTPDDVGMRVGRISWSGCILRWVSGCLSRRSLSGQRARQDGKVALPSQSVRNADMRVRVRFWLVISCQGFVVSSNLLDAPWDARSISFCFLIFPLFIANAFQKKTHQ